MKRKIDFSKFAQIYTQNLNTVDAQIDYQEAVLKAYLLPSEDFSIFERAYRKENLGLYLDCLRGTIALYKSGVALDDILKLSDETLAQATEGIVSKLYPSHPVIDTAKYPTAPKPKKRGDS